jgi:GTPase
MKFGFVSLIGRPNAGKSTLVNRLVGSKLAIVSDKPQTTRTRILGVKNYPDAQVVYLDTPGIHRPLHRMNVRMVDTAVDTIHEVDVLGLVVDASEPPGKGDQFMIDLVGRALSASARTAVASFGETSPERLRRDGGSGPASHIVRPTAFLILNKIDLLRKSKLLPIMDRYSKLADFAEIIPVSALSGDNVDRLERTIIDRLPEGEPRYPPEYLTDQPERFFAAEIVREQVLRFTHAEIPFSSAVIIDRFEEPEPPSRLLRLYCTIVVERESQKPIVVGKGGDMIKKIGTAAREELERFFDLKVFLDLHVRVKAEWREDETVLADIGLGHRHDS